MTPIEILEIDSKRNSQGEDAQGLVRLINIFKAKYGASIIREGDTLILYHETDKNNVEFHCFNADTAENLAKNVLRFFDTLKKNGYKTAETPYDNPKITKLFQQSIEPKNLNITKGKYHDYIAKVIL